jgi:hypothetical protein
MWIGEDRLVPPPAIRWSIGEIAQHYFELGHRYRGETHLLQLARDCLHDRRPALLLPFAISKYVRF